MGRSLPRRLGDDGGMNVRVVIAGVFAMLLIAGPALAQPGRTPVQAPHTYQPGPPAPTYTKRYGTSIALADAASVAAVFVGAMLVVAGALSEYDCEYECGDNDGSVALGFVLMIGGSAGYVFGGPLIHRHHGNSSGAGKSLALRLGLPLAGVLIGSALRDDNCSDYDCGDDYSGQLTSLGVASAMVIDWAFLAKKQVRVPGPVMPYATPVHGGGMTFGVGGSF